MKRHSPEEIIGLLREAEASREPVADFCKGIAEQTLYRWRHKYGGLDVSEARRLKALEVENVRLKKLVAEDAGGGDGFGRSVALRGGVAVIGAPGEDERGSEAGAAYIFERDQGGAGMWGQRKKILGSETTASASRGGPGTICSSPRAYESG